MTEDQSRAEPGSREDRWLTPINDGSYTDPEGVLWTRRGRRPEARRLRQLGRDVDVAILHGYGGALEVVTGSARAELWARAAPYLLGDLDRAPGDHTNFQAAEFKAADGRRLLVLEESC